MKLKIPEELMVERKAGGIVAVRSRDGTMREIVAPRDIVVKKGFVILGDKDDS